LDAVVSDRDGFWSAGNATRPTAAGVAKVRPQGQHRLGLWRRRLPARLGARNRYPVLWFGAAKEGDAGHSGVQSIGSAVVDVTPGDYFEIIVRQTSGSTKNVAADELTWFALEV
jgi:hypothetical protein